MAPYGTYFGGRISLTFTRSHGHRGMYIDVYFLGEIHRCLKTKGMTPPEAVESAQISISRQYLFGFVIKKGLTANLTSVNPYFHTFLPKTVLSGG